MPGALPSSYATSTLSAGASALSSPRPSGGASESGPLSARIVYDNVGPYYEVCGGGWPVVVPELQVWSRGENVAWQGVATGSAPCEVCGSAPVNWGPELAIDGNNGTFFHARQNDGASSWFSLQLATAVPVDRVVYVNVGCPCCMRAVGDYLRVMATDGSVIANLGPLTDAATQVFEMHAATRTMTRTMTSTPSFTPSPTSTPCFSDNFRLFPRMDLVGSLLSSRALIASSAQSAFSRPPALQACEEACCQQPGCVGYSVSASRPNDGFDNCFLFANVTELMPNNAFASGLLRSAL